MMSRVFDAGVYPQRSGDHSSPPALAPELTSTVTHRVHRRRGGNGDAPGAARGERGSARVAVPVRGVVAAGAAGSDRGSHRGN